MTWTREKVVLLLWFFVVFESSMLNGLATKNPRPQAPTFNVDYENVTTLQALLDFSMRNQVPIGIVLGPNSGLCLPLKGLKLKNAPLEKVLDGLLGNSEYSWANDQGVYVVKPKTVPEGSDRILHIKYSQYRITESTLQGLGIILSSRIRSSLDPDASTAISILSSSDSITVKPFTLENVTVEQIANHIVSLDDKGVWILEPHPYESGQTKKGHLQVYGYRDDAASLKSLSCATVAKN